MALPPATEAADPAAVRYLYWRDRGEATVYLDGVPYYGIDPGHHHAPLPAGVSDLLIESHCARTGIWVDGEPQGIDMDLGSRFDGAYLASRNDDAWSALHDLDVLLQLIELQQKPEYPPGYALYGRGGYRPEITAAAPLLRQLIHRVNLAVDAYDQDGLPAFAATLRQIYDDFPAHPDAMQMLLTGHAHVDLVWLWPERAGEFKAVHSFANALRMIEQYPEVTFGYSQPASYEAVQRRSPALMDQVRAAIADKRWEATGALYVESDVQLPCGEALVRAFSLGQAGFRDLRGSDSRCVWIPDVFGYSACLPTIMAGFNVPYFYTTKLHWSGATRFPYSSFNWTGMDGSTVTSHISWNHYNQEIKPREFNHGQLQHRQSAIHREGLFPCGYGDGGGGLNEAMCERARRLQNLTGMPKAKWGLIEDFFDRLQEQADQLPTWRGEMYLEYHRGVQTTHSDLKAAFRAAERGLQVWEAVRCATGGGPIDEQYWKRVVFAQFHDYIPGSSIAEVYEEAVPELQSIADHALQQAQSELETHEVSSDPADGPGAENSPTDCIFNPLAMPLAATIGDRRVTLPPLAGVAVAELATLDAPAPTAENRRLANGRVEATFNDSGELCYFLIDGHPLAFEQPAAQLWTFPDVPAVYDAWDIDRAALSLGTHHEHAAAVEYHQTPAAASITFTRELGEVAEASGKGDLGSYTVCYTLEAGSPVLRLDVELDLQRAKTLVKLAFPTAYRGREARYGGPFGSVQRPQWPGPLANEAMFENPASRWATISDDDDRDGLMLITQAKYGLAARDGLLHLSLARSAKISTVNVTGDTTTLQSGDGHQHADLGPQRIRLALGQFKADNPRPQQPAALADTLFTPPVPYHGHPVSAGLLDLDAPASLVPAWALPYASITHDATANDPNNTPDAGGWTLRLHETLGSRGPLTLHLADHLTPTPTDLRGQSLDADPQMIRTKPYSLLSVRINSA